MKYPREQHRLNVAGIGRNLCLFDVSASHRDGFASSQIRIVSASYSKGEVSP